MANNLDTLMDKDPLDLTAQDIDAIIASHRKGRAAAASGTKAKRETGPKIDISALVQEMTQGAAPVAAKIRRR